MKKTWHIWTVFVLCLAIVLPAMIWLSLKIHEIDQVRENDRVQTELARREAELQERINSALYRMDWMLTPMIAQEAARPYYLYQPFYRISTDNELSQQLDSEPVHRPKQPSPLLVQPSEFVLLHFQLGPDNIFSSPQTPSWEACDGVIGCDSVTAGDIADSQQKLKTAQTFCSFDQIKARCPSFTPNDDQTNSMGSAQTVYLDPSFNRVVPDPKLQALTDKIADVLANDTGGKNQKVIEQQERGASRGNTEFMQRVKGSQNYANQWATNNSIQQQQMGVPMPAQTRDPMVREGVMRPIWIDGNLLLVRRVAGGKTELVQCCWLNWDRIQKALREEVKDILPKLEFEPLANNAEHTTGRTLATLPVNLVVDSSALMGTLALNNNSPSLNRVSGLQWALIVAWCGLGLAALAAALLLNGVVKLSERRAAFVSAVTHELRTPLTTFRMYAEMMAEKMVPPEKQTSYANTLKTQADRLSHLVENVLQFARLEQGKQRNRNEEISVGELFDRFHDRLLQRVEQAEMELLLEIESCRKRVIHTDPAKIEQIVFNMVDNACKYASHVADRRIILSCTDAGKLNISVRDFGPGVDAKFQKTLFQPFCKSDQDAANSAPGVGLGLALCNRMARSLGGRIYHVPTDQGAKFVLEL